MNELLMQNVFDKIQHAFIIKTLNTLNYLHTMEAIYKKPTVKIIVNGKILKSFSSRIGMPSFTPSTQHSPGRPNKSK